MEMLAVCCDIPFHALRLPKCFPGFARLSVCYEQQVDGDECGTGDTDRGQHKYWTKACRSATLSPTVSHEPPDLNHGTALCCRKKSDRLSVGNRTPILQSSSPQPSRHADKERVECQNPLVCRWCDCSRCSLQRLSYCPHVRGSWFNYGQWQQFVPSPQRPDRRRGLPFVVLSGYQRRFSCSKVAGASR